MKRKKQNIEYLDSWNSEKIVSSRLSVEPWEIQNIGSDSLASGSVRRAYIVPGTVKKIGTDEYGNKIWTACPMEEVIKNLKYSRDNGGWENESEDWKSYMNDVIKEYESSVEKELRR